MIFKEELSSIIKDVEKNLEEYLPVKNNNQSDIYEAMRYSLFAGGKRLRPVIMLSICKMLCGDYKKAMGFACAIEMIHTYSLVHDDLPAMDNDDYRRGKLTNHKVYGEAMAILAGDALLNKAFEVALEESVKLNLEEDKIIKSLMVLANLSGTEGMIGGQVVDLVSERKEIDIDILKYMHYMKTGALIRCAAKIGCIIGGANEQQMDLIGEYANNLGLAFQIKDDILDVVGNPEKIGKPIGSDRGNNKSTFVTLMGIDKSKKFEKELTKKSIESMKSFGYQSEFLVSLANYLLNRDY